MAHVRTQIRAAFKAALDGALGAGYVVYASRKFAWNHVEGVALVDMRFLNDQTQDRETMSGARAHTASLYVRVQRAADEDTLDNDLDQDEVRVIAAIEAVDWSSLLEEDPELVQVNFSDDGDGGRAMGAIVLRYDLEYRIEKSDPETVIP